MLKPTYILGINTTYHETSAAIIKDGILITCIEEERLSRIKRGKAAEIDNPDKLPFLSIDYCLKYAGIKSEDLSFIGLSFDPKKRLEGIGLDPYYIEDSWGSESGEKRFVEHLNRIPKILNSYLNGFDENNIKWISHHIAHAASTFLVSPYTEAAIICIDGLGEVATTWMGKGCDNKISTIKEIMYPNSLGLLWEGISKFLGFTEYDAAKVMGLASYGNPENFYQHFQRILDLNIPDTFVIDNGITKFRLDKYDSLESLFQTPKINNIKELTSVHQDIAASLQKITNDTMIHLVKYIANETKLDNLCLAGGVALNCVANHEILKSGYFKNIYIQPASNDAGTALGTALYIWNSLMNKKRVYAMDDSYTAADYTNDEIREALEKEQLNYEEVNDIEDRVSLLLSESNNIIGWFQGKMEWGPRALGNRSLLADPRNPDMKDILNLRIKKREFFRPFAPSVLEEFADEWFIIPQNSDSMAKQFMLFTFPVREEKAHLIPAVVHVNNTSRVQTVNKNTNARYHKLISKFQEKTGIPMLLNTSLNDNEPIVCSPLDAIKTFRKTKMDYLAIGDFLISAT